MYQNIVVPPNQAQASMRVSFERLPHNVKTIEWKLYLQACSQLQNKKKNLKSGVFISNQEITRDPNALSCENKISCELYKSLF